jgi:hypothetical protein
MMIGDKISSLRLLNGWRYKARIVSMVTNSIKNSGDDPVITVGMKVMFIHRGGWFVGDVLRLDGERVLIERQ